MVPAEASHPLAGSLAALRRAGIGGQRRLMVEYIPFAGVNDSPRHAQALAALLRGLPCRVNLIPYNSVPDAPLQGAARPAIERFQRELLRLGLRTHIRRSRGADIAAACGMLSTAAGAHPPLPPSSPEGGPGPAGQRP
jgi:23S rRNA (adenine2503-C2)-methyltransferase